jgi:hypothetical protein
MMSKRLVSLLLSALLLNAFAAVAAGAQTRQVKEATRAQRVKATIAALGTGEAARVRVVLRGRTRLKGHVGEAGGESFTVVDPRTGVVTTVPYTQVRSVNPRELPEVAKAAITFGVFLGALMAVTAYAVSNTK